MWRPRINLYLDIEVRTLLTACTRTLNGLVGILPKKIVFLVFFLYFLIFFAGVPHSGEIPYVWGWPLLDLSPEVRGDVKMLFNIVPCNDLDYEYAEFTMDLFTNFAKFL